MEQINVVLKTDDYSIFKSITGNRRINTQNVKRLKKSMTIQLLEVPIIVNEKYQIIDGQHRFLAVKELELPVYYIVVKGYGLTEVHRLNVIGKNWTFYDYLNGYADAGLEDYIEARRFIEKYKFGSAETLSLLLGYNSLAGSFDRTNFDNGHFKIKSINDAIRKAEMITMVKPFYNGYKRRNLIAAFLKLFNNNDFDFDLFLSKIALNRDKMYDCSNINQYLLRIEEIYNHYNKNKLRAL